MPLYTYKCPHCESKVELNRTIPEVYDEVICLNCSESFDGRECKLMDIGITGCYPQGKLKGNTNNYGSF